MKDMFGEAVDICGHHWQQGNPLPRIAETLTFPLFTVNQE